MTRNYRGLHQTADECRRPNFRRMSKTPQLSAKMLIKNNSPNNSPTTDFYYKHHKSKSVEQKEIRQSQKHTDVERLTS